MRFSVGAIRLDGSFTVGYARGRVIIGVKLGFTDAQLAQALADHHATIVASYPDLGQIVLAVPDGTVPEAVAGLARYSFITFAAPDMLAHTDPRASKAS